MQRANQLRHLSRGRDEDDEPEQMHDNRYQNFEARPIERHFEIQDNRDQFSPPEIHNYQTVHELEEQKIQFQQYQERVDSHHNSNFTLGNNVDSLTSMELQNQVSFRGDQNHNQ